MHLAIGSRRALYLCALTSSLALSACASSGDSLPPAAVPEPLAMAGPEPTRAAEPLRPADPVRSALGTAAPGVPRKAARTPEKPRTSSKTVPPGPERPRPGPRVRAAKVRVDSAALEREVTRRFAYQPLSVALAQRTRKTELADRIAAAVVYEAARLKMSPSLLAAVLIIENAPFDTTARSSQGAVGLMQVMPVHIGSYGCSSEDLHDVEANICHGARLLHAYIRRAKSVQLGLKRYNGCVRGRNTPRCYRYPARVLRTASKVRHDLLLAAEQLAAGEDGDSTLALAPEGSTDVPSQPVINPDSTITTTSASECTTFIGCLRHRWTQK